MAKGSSKAKPGQALVPSSSLSLSMALAVAMVLVAACTLVLFQQHGSVQIENGTPRVPMKVNEAMSNDELLAYTQKYSDQQSTRCGVYEHVVILRRPHDPVPIPIGAYCRSQKHSGVNV